MVEAMPPETSRLVAALRGAALPLDKAYLAWDLFSSRWLIVVGIDSQASKREIYRRLAASLDVEEGEPLVEDFYLVPHDDPSLLDVELASQTSLQWTTRAAGRVTPVLVAGREVVDVRPLRVTGRDLEQAVARTLDLAGADVSGGDYLLPAGLSPDLVVRGPQGPVLVECKAYTRRVDVNSLVELSGLVHIAQLTASGRARGILITTTDLTPSAERLLGDLEDVTWVNWSTPSATQQLLSTLAS